MKITADWKVNLRDKKVQRLVDKACEESLKDTVILIAAESIRQSPWLTGNNARSIKYSASEKGGSIYSTSGYGGYLETGTVHMDPRPYMRPALDMHMGKLPSGIKTRLSRGEG